MTLEELLAELEALVAKAKAAESDPEAPGLTEEEANRAEELRVELEALEAKAARAKSLEDLQERGRKIAKPATKPYVAPAATADDSDSDEKEYEKAFVRMLRDRQPNQDVMERAQSHANTEGGYTIPTTFRDKLVDRLKAFGGIQNAVENLNTNSGEPMVWPTIDDTANVAERVAENATNTTGNDLVFGQATLNAYEYQAAGAGGLPLRVSWSLLADSAVDLPSLIADKFALRLHRIMAVDLVKGDGSNKPKGLVHGKTGFTQATGLTFTYDSLLEAEHSLDPEYRGSGCVWAFNDKSLLALKKLKDPGTGAYLFVPDNMGDTIFAGRLNGYPVVIDQGFDDYDGTDGELVNWGAFGNLKEGYVRRLVNDVTLVVNPWTRASYRQTEFTMWARMDGVPQNPYAYIALAGTSA